MKKATGVALVLMCSFGVIAAGRQNGGTGTGQGQGTGQMQQPAVGRSPSQGQTDGSGLPAGAGGSNPVKTEPVVPGNPERQNPVTTEPVIPGDASHQNPVESRPLVPAQQPAANQGAPALTQPGACSAGGSGKSQIYTYDRRQDYKNYMFDRMREFDGRIESLSQDRLNLPPEARQQLEQSVADLRRQSSALRGQLNGIDGATAQNWDAVRGAIGDRMVQLDSSISAQERRMKQMPAKMKYREDEKMQQGSKTQP